MDLISIIIPIYKVEAYLNQCIESVVNQSYFNLEIILVDDGSPDGCPLLCDEWGKKEDRIKVIHKENGGLSDARNAGLKIASGSYIAFVDSDDWIEKDYIYYLYRAIIENKADISACEVRNVYDGTEVPEITKSMPYVKICTPKDAIGGLVKGCNFRAVAWNKLYRKELLQDERFEVGRLHEDEFFTYRIYDKASVLAFIDIPLYNYRQRQGSIMATLSVGHLDALDAYIERLYFLKNKYPDLYYRDKISFCVACVNYYIETLRGKFDDKKSVQKRIKLNRRKVHFSIIDFCSYSVKSKLYIIGSTGMFIYIFSKMCIVKGYRR